MWRPRPREHRLMPFDFMSADLVRTLNETECWDLLDATPTGRLVVVVGDDVDVYPVNHVVSDRAVYLRTAPRSKLLRLIVDQMVAYEVDGLVDELAFGVVLKGHAEQLELQPEIEAADLLPVRPWIPTLTYRWVRILPSSISGRAFRRGPEPERS